MNFNEKWKSFFSIGVGNLIKSSTLACLIIIFGSNDAFASKSIKEKNVKEVALQQNSKVTGTVNDQSGMGIPGVNVTVKGTAIGTITNLDGQYTLDVPANGILVYSFIGFETQEISTAGRSSIDVTLVEESLAVGEVVVTALGIKRETKKLGYSVTEMKGKELSESNVVNPVESLKGKVAGVYINTGTGGPQASSRITIRGNTSLSGNNQPIFVVDGVIMENSTTGAGEWGAGQDFGNEMKNLNPDDFESVSVLKGAAATALYGSRAANGVIMITTKKGAAGKKGLGVSVSNKTSFEYAYAGPDFQNEYGSGTKSTFDKNDAGENQVSDAYYYQFGPKFDGNIQARDLDGNLIPWVANEKNFLDVYDVGYQTNTNVALSGGSESTTFRFSYGNNKSKGITPGNKFDRNSILLRATQKLSDRVSVDGIVSYVRSNTDNPARQGGNSNALFQFVYGIPRYYDMTRYKDNYIHSDGGILSQDSSLDRVGGSNFWFDLYEKNAYQKEDNLRLSLETKADITDWLSLKLRGNVNNTYITNEKKFLGGNKGFTGGEYKVQQETREQHRLIALLTANKNFGEDFETSLSVGGETWESKRQFTMSRTHGGLKEPYVWAITNSKDVAKTNSLITGREKSHAVYAFANVAWRNMLYLDLTARNDWSSTLAYPKGYDLGDVSYFYPSTTLSWIFTETIDLPEWFSFGKLRGSYAVVGNGTSPYATNKGLFYKFDKNYIDHAGNNVGLYGFDSSNLGSLDLKPELTHSMEFGLDVKLFNNRVGLDVAYYKSNSKNQILSLPLAIETGVETQLVNAGNIQNQGVEVLLSVTPIRKPDLEWTSTFTFTRNRNKVIELIDGVDEKVLEWAMGRDVQSVAIAGEDYGVLRTKYAYARYQHRDENGNEIAHASNGQKVLKADGRYVRSQDYGQGYAEVGNIQPDFLAGMHNTINYKDFNLRFLIDARFGGEFLSATYNYGTMLGSLANTLQYRDEASGGIKYTDSKGETQFGLIPEGVFGQDVKIKDTEGIEHSVGGMTYREVYEQGLVDPVKTMSYYARLGSWGSGIREHAVHESTWIAMRELSVGYNIPSSLSSKIGVQNARVSLIGRNLFYFYNSLPDNINPEGLYNNRAGSAMEYGGVPYTRTFGFSVDLTF